MKKRINLVLLLVISFVFFASNVEAATEIVCGYAKGKVQPAIKIVQTEDGKKKVYKTREKDMPDIDSKAWKQVAWPKFDDDSELKECPKYLDFEGGKSYYLNKKKTGYVGLYYERKGKKENDSDGGKTKPEEIKSCEDLFDKDIRDFINKIMSWIKILVPILLIVYGVLDFSKSVFDGKEDEMKKNRERFIKRVIAAVLVFFVPLFVNLVLTIANSVWSWISPTTCIK